MKAQEFLTIAAMASALLAVNANAITINFIEGAEGQNVTVQYTAHDWWSPPPTGSPFSTGLGTGIEVTAGPESARFSGGQPADYGTGLLAVILLRESAGGPLSDWVTVSRVQLHTEFGETIARFILDFQSDTDGQTLPAPSTVGALTVLDVVETGALQTFNIPYPGYASLMTVGIQSDVVEPSPVPDGGATLGLLGIGAACTLGVRRLRR